MDRPKFFRALEELFEEETGTIHELTEFKTLDGWDSMTFVGLIALVDEHVGVPLAPTSIRNSTTVQDLMMHLEDRIRNKAA